VLDLDISVTKNIYLLDEPLVGGLLVECFAESDERVGTSGRVENGQQTTALGTTVDDLIDVEIVVLGEYIDGEQVIDHRRGVDAADQLAVDSLEGDS